MASFLFPLLQVIYALNTKNDEHEAAIATLKEAHEEEVQQILSETREKILQVWISLFHLPKCSMFFLLEGGKKITQKYTFLLMFAAYVEGFFCGGVLLYTGKQPLSGWLICFGLEI